MDVFEPNDTPQYIRVSARNRQPLVDFMVAGLVAAGCRIIRCAPADRAPFRISFELPTGERMGIVAYAALANDPKIQNRPQDEHRFQLKYGSKPSGLGENVLDLWQDPYGIYTTLLVGINAERGFFVASDPLFRTPTKTFVSLAYWKEADAQEILKQGWCAWERGVRIRDEMSDDQRPVDDDPVEVLVGGRRDSFLRYVLMERAARELGSNGLDPGHRQLLAEQLNAIETGRRATSVPPPPAALHALAAELEMTEQEVLDMIQRTPRLKMAVRGWAAEDHLARDLAARPGMTEVAVLTGQGEADVALRYQGGPRIRIQCKNVLRRTTRPLGLPRLDFQRTRASQADKCSRYYSPNDFEVVAACLHAVEQKWVFRFRLAREMTPHATCQGKLAYNVTIDQAGDADPAVGLGRAG
ncbi:MAG: hypothetical protein IT384_30050 [Deltaproteobacteria bacterium]|nr:hypothetical protein [Deltaproteobacteria bacterium]